MLLGALRFSFNKNAKLSTPPIGVFGGRVGTGDPKDFESSSCYFDLLLSLHVPPCFDGHRFTRSVVRDAIGGCPVFADPEWIIEPHGRIKAHKGRGPLYEGDELRTGDL